MKEKERISILIADDSVTSLKALETYLRREDREISLAHDGNQALGILAGRATDIVVTDLVMPGVDGLALLKSALELNPLTLVILMTGYGSIDTAVRAMNEGAFDYKTKPFLLEEIGLSIHRAETYLTLRRERDQLLQERNALRERLHHLQEKMVGLELRASSDGAADGASSKSRLHVLRNPLGPHEVSSSYLQWESEPRFDEDMILLKHLRDQGAITTDQFDRLRNKLVQGRRMVS